MKKFILLLLSSVGVTFISFSKKWGDYTLYNVQNATTTYLIDTTGTTVKTWTHASTAKTGYSSYLTPGGTFLMAMCY